MIYDPKSKENEALSLNLAEKFCQEIKYDSNCIKHCIAATIDHKLPAEIMDSYKPTVSLLLDLDVWILGTNDWNEYRDYALNIRKEYSFVEIAVYKEKRVQVLESFLSRDFIYQTQHFSEAYEQVSRHNMSREIRDIIPIIE